MKPTLAALALALSACSTTSAPQGPLFGDRIVDGGLGDASHDASDATLDHEVDAQGDAADARPPEKDAAED
jgi:hypothetical protein